MKEFVQMLSPDKLLLQILVDALCLCHLPDDRTQKLLFHIFRLRRQQTGIVLLAAQLIPNSVLKDFRFQWFHILHPFLTSL